MTRCKSLKEGIFKFFENLDRDINAVKSPENPSIHQEISRECKLMSTNLYKNENPEVAKSICEDFLKLYISLKDSVSEPNNNPNYLSAVGFLNYWLNAELKKKMFNENIIVNDFYDHIESYAVSIRSINFLGIGEICVIKNDELDNMNILFNLYSDYHKIYSNDKLICAHKSICLDYSKKCVEEYKKGIIKCEKNESDFCKAIRVFEKKYERLIQNNKKKGDFNTKDLITLPSYEVALKEYQSELYRRKITIAIISIICSIFGIILILFYLYKFTPFGKWLPINKKNQEKRHAMKEKMYNFIDNSNEYNTYNEYTPYRFGYNST